jgi:hypothetical protein
MPSSVARPWFVLLVLLIMGLLVGVVLLRPWNNEDSGVQTPPGQSRREARVVHASPVMLPSVGRPTNSAVQKPGAPDHLALETSAASAERAAQAAADLAATQ